MMPDAVQLPAPRSEGHRAIVALCLALDGWDELSRWCSDYPGTAARVARVVSQLHPKDGDDRLANKVRKTIRVLRLVPTVEAHMLLDALEGVP
jgi:hypothetical protein